MPIACLFVIYRLLPAATIIIELSAGQTEGLTDGQTLLNWYLEVVFHVDCLTFQVDYLSFQMFDIRSMCLLLLLFLLYFHS